MAGAEADVRLDPTPVVIAQREQLIAAARAVTGMDRHRAEDVVSIVTERVLRLGTVPRNAEAWLAYMHQAVVREARREAQRASRTVPLDGDALSGLDPAVDSVAARLQWFDAMDDLRALPPDERQVFLLRHYEALSYAQIAATTGLPEDGVDNRLRRAAKRLGERRAEREASGAYLLFAAFARSARRTSLSGPPVVAVAGAAALSVLAVVAAPVPRLLRPDARSIPVESGIESSSGRRDSGGNPSGTRSGVEATRADAADPRPVVRTLPRPTPPPAAANVPVAVNVCATVACATTRPPATRPRGDGVTVTRLPVVQVWQHVVSACWALPDNPEVRCDPDDPSRYRVRQPGHREPDAQQDRALASGKSEASAPASWEPSKEARP